MYQREYDSNPRKAIGEGAMAKTAAWTNREIALAAGSSKLRRSQQELLREIVAGASSGNESRSAPRRRKPKLVSA
jgi:hypothetical protein